MQHMENRYEGSTFAVEKMIATLYAIMFAAILMAGVADHFARSKHSIEARALDALCDSENKETCLAARWSPPSR
jgi:hypothetical protein